VAQFRDALAGRVPVPPRAGTKGAATPVDQAAPAAFEKTIQVSASGSPAARKPGSTSRAPASAPASRFRNEHFSDTPERSVMLPPKSQSPLKAVLLLLVLVGAAAGAWTTRQQWMPAVGLQVAAAPAAEGASSPEEPASAIAVAEPASAPASQPVALALASAAAPSAAASAPEPASSTSEAVASVAPAAPATAEPAAPVAVAAPRAHPAHAKPVAESRNKARAARIAALTLPPPTLPPANEGQVVSQSRPLVGSSTNAEPAEAVAAAAPAAHGGLGPREACAGLAPAKMAACVKQLCDNEPRYQAYPACQRVRRQEDRQSGATE
jgi:hypothetical protein